jgi:hypothetical protein
MTKWVLCFLAGLGGAFVGVLMTLPAVVAADFDDRTTTWSEALVGVGTVLILSSLFVFWIVIPSFLAWRWSLRWLNLKGIANGLVESIMCFLAGLPGAFIGVGVIVLAAAIWPPEEGSEGGTGLAMVALGLLVVSLSLFVFWIAIPGFLLWRGFWCWLKRRRQPESL